MLLFLIMNPEDLYRIYSNHLKEKYGEKVYKLPVNIPCTCPNRDGTKGVKGCIFCGASGSGHELLGEDMTVTEQLKKNQIKIEKKYKAHKFIAYYQSFSNTYLDLEAFREYMTEGARFPGIVELAVSTRPDCILIEHLDILKSIQEKYNINITIELGLQTANDETLKILNRGHSLNEFQDAARMIKAYGFELCTHVISDLPWDSEDDILALAEVLNTSTTDYLKIHSLYVEKNTKLEELYNSGLKLLTAEDFINRTILLLEHIDPKIVIERLIGRVPESDSVIANWHQSWWKIRDQLYLEMENRNTYQGKKYGPTKR